MRKHYDHVHNLLIGLVVFLILLCFSSPIKSEILRPVIKVERLGNAQIERSNQYSENTRIRIRLLYPQGSSRAGELLTGLPDEVQISEYVTGIYDGLYGASLLPVSFPAVEGEWIIELKSLARYPVPDQRFSPVPRIEVRYDGQLVSLEIPQWVDNDGNEQIDWLEQRVADLLADMRNSPVPIVVEVISAVDDWRESYRLECGGIEAKEPYVARISPSCMNWEGQNDHRLNERHELAATMLHEARHIWQRRHDMMTPEALQNAPLTRTTGYQGCERSAKDCFTQYVIGEGHPQHLEDDAEAFADRYKSLFP